MLSPSPIDMDFGVIPFPITPTSFVFRRFLRIRKQVTETPESKRHTKTQPTIKQIIAAVDGSAVTEITEKVTYLFSCKEESLKNSIKIT